MKLILKRSVPDLGEPGDVVSVKPGYGRNYLLPQGLAYEATEGNLRLIEEERKLSEARAQRDFREGKRRASQLEGVVLEFRARASEEGRLFGSVGVSDIVEQLNARELDFEVEKRFVMLDEPIKELGVHTVVLRLFEGAEVALDVQVEREDD